MGIDKLANKKTTLTQNDSLFHNEVSIPLRHPKNLGKWGTLSASLLICGAALTSQAQPVMAAEADAPTNSIVVQTGTSTDDLIVSQGYGDQDFLNYLGSSAQKLAEKNNLYASVMVAQALLESGWGTSSLAQAPNFNLFGVKGTFQGAAVNLSTQEDDGSGSLYTIQSNFRKYPSYRESLEDYVRLLRSNGRLYANVWRSNAATYQDATKALTGRYATDTSYNEKLDALIEKYNLTRFDEATPDNGTATINVNAATTAEQTAAKVQPLASVKQVKKDAYQTKTAPVIVQNDYNRHDSAAAALDDTTPTVSDMPIIDNDVAQLIHQQQQFLELMNTQNHSKVSNGSIYAVQEAPKVHVNTRPETSQPSDSQSTGTQTQPSTPSETNTSAQTISSDNPATDAEQTTSGLYQRTSAAPGIQVEHSDIASTD